MCGICGIIDLKNKPIQQAALYPMMQRMKYRGPDDEGIFIDRNVGLGFVRLSIIDLSEAGHQPMQDESHRYTIVFNGEIYNYIELREELKIKGATFTSHTDTEVLLYSYIYWGKECLDKLNGMFAFVIYDKETNTVFGARDRFGVKPLYYCITENQFIFASEIPPILETKCIKPEANNQVIFDYLVFNRTDQTENTFFVGIKKLQHGHSFIIKHGEYKDEEWYNLRERVKGATPFKGEQEYRDSLNSSIKLRLRSDVPLGVCLSGGLDSSSIASIVYEDFENSNLNTFSAIYNKGERGDESEYIDEFRGTLRNMFFTHPMAETLYQDIPDLVRIHAEPFPSLGPYAQYKVMQKAKENVTVTLDGQGADEELAGYHYFYGFYFKDLLRSFQICKLLCEMKAYWYVHHSIYAYKTFLYFLLPKRLRTLARANEYGYISHDFIKRFSKQNSIAGNLYGSSSLNEALLDHFNYKLEHLLKWDDRNSMASSVESRVPFLDYHLVERTLATQSSEKIQNGVTKSILRRAMKGTLPEKIRNRMDKVGFDLPQDEWFRTPIFQEYICAIINSEEFANRGYFDVHKVKELYQKHVNREMNISKEIWKWIHLELWFREFIDRKN